MYKNCVFSRSTREGKRANCRVFDLIQTMNKWCDCYAAVGFPNRPRRRDWQVWEVCSKLAGRQADELTF